MKEPIYPTTSWEGYTRKIKEYLDTKLSEGQAKKAMQAYINGVKVEDYLKEIEK